MQKQLANQISATPVANKNNDKSKSSSFKHHTFEDEDSLKDSKNSKIELNYFKNLYHFYKTPLVKFFYYYVGILCFS
jgi:hypothetical protein